MHTCVHTWAMQIDNSAVACTLGILALWAKIPIVLATSTIILHIPKSTESPSYVHAHKRVLPICSNTHQDDGCSLDRLLAAWVQVHITSTWDHTCMLPTHACAYDPRQGGLTVRLSHIIHTCRHRGLTFVNLQLNSSLRRWSATNPPIIYATLFQK